MFYFVKTPGWLQKIYKGRIWNIDAKEKNIYLTFDDGPHPEITDIILDKLKTYNASATFFCIGKNVVAYPDVYKRIIEEGHAVGNHTHNHLNGWKTSDATYLDNIALAKKYIDSNLFRPPYGRITKFQERQLQKNKFQLNIIMWSVLSGDFDTTLKPKQCLENVLLNTKEGSIIVFHDSEKAKEAVLFSLPEVLKYFTAKGYFFKKITL
ncbi:MAG: polysaccharide deacetylase family protein [Ferruginibacter sp.]